MGKIILIATFLTLLFCGHVQAGREHPERWYQARWCASIGGRQEVALPDGTRCDCVTATHAIEFDFGDKWAEAIGQSLYYSFQTGKRAGVVLILESDKDRRYLMRLESVIRHYRLPVDVWLTGK